MRRETWSTVDLHLGALFATEDHALRAAIDGGQQAGLPAI